MRGQKRPQNKVWGQLDSNQRSRKTRDLQSLAIAAMRYPQEEKDSFFSHGKRQSFFLKHKMLTVGLEPTTIRLQIGRSTS